MMTEDEEEAQVLLWEKIYEGTKEIAARYGRENPAGNGDYFIVDDNYGWRRTTIGIFDLKMLNPALVVELRKLLDGIDNWDIVIAVDVPGKETSWPKMGLTIRRKEVIDGLQRQFLPQEFRDVIYEGARPGTGYD